MQHRLAFSLVFLTGLAGTPYASAQDSINPAAAPTDPASPNAATALTQDEIAAAIGRLGSPQYEIREEASRLLKRAGAEAIEPLARAAAGENLEVVWRAIRLLERQLDSDDEAAFDAAELALEKLEVSSNRSAARRAAASLETQPGRRWKRALARFEAAGGWGVWRKIEDSGAGFPQPRTEILLPTYLVIPPGWTGGEAALQQVKRMDAALSMESFKPRVYVVDGCGIPQTAIDAMQNSLQQMEFQARGKARLAVSFDFRARATEVASIEPDAADLTKEKLKKQDLIVKYDGEELIDFEHLTRITRKHDVGDRIPVEVVREGKIVTFEIELVGWKKPEKPETAPAKN